MRMRVLLLWKSIAAAPLPPQWNGKKEKRETCLWALCFHLDPPLMSLLFVSFFIPLCRTLYVCLPVSVFNTQIGRVVLYWTNAAERDALDDNSVELNSTERKNAMHLICIVALHSIGCLVARSGNDMKTIWVQREEEDLMMTAAAYTDDVAGII